MLGLLPTNYTVATLRAVVAKFVRENHQFTWLTKVFLALVKEAARFGGDLLAYADHMEKDGMWWGQFEFVVAGIVLSIDVRMLFGVTWESTFGIKMQVEIELEADQIPLKFRIECDVCLHLALVNIVTRKFECFETANHWVVLKEASRARNVGGALFSRTQTLHPRSAELLFNELSQALDEPEWQEVLVCRVHVYFLFF